MPSTPRAPLFLLYRQTDATGVYVMPPDAALALKLRALRDFLAACAAPELRWEVADSTGHKAALQVQDLVPTGAGTLRLELAQRMHQGNAHEYQAVAEILAEWQAAHSPTATPWRPQDWPPLAAWGSAGAGGEQVYCVPSDCPAYAVWEYLYAFLQEYADWQERAVEWQTDRRTWPLVTQATVRLTTHTGQRAALTVPCRCEPEDDNKRQLRDMFAAVFCGQGNGLEALKGLDEFRNCSPAFTYHVRAIEPLAVKEKVAREFWLRYQAHEPRPVPVRPASGYRGYFLLETKQAVNTSGDSAPVTLCLVMTRISPTNTQEEWEHFYTMVEAWQRGPGPSDPREPEFA